MGTQITALTRLPLRVPTGTRWAGFGVAELEVVHVTVTDAEGGTGTGFTFSISGGAAAMQTLVSGLVGQATVGSELEGWERRWHGLWARTHRLGRGVAVPALSAVDIAILGPARPPRWAAPVPAAGCLPGPGTGLPQLDRMAAMSLRSWSRRPPPTSGRALPRSSCFVGRACLPRSWTGWPRSARPLAPGSGSWSTPTSAWTSRTRCGSAASAAHDIYWLEEPLVADDVAGHARLAERLAVPIAAGEHLIGRFEFLEYLRQVPPR